MPKKPFLYNKPTLKKYRQDLRNNGTAAEAVMWTMLKNKQIDGWKFRRQYSVGNYILDFYCPAARLAIELDGQGHFTTSGFEYDQERTAYLNGHDIQVIRFENKEIFNRVEAVVEEIKHHLPPQAPPTKEGS